MSLDIIELAINGIKNFNLFESLSNEIMYDYGYKNIIPLGGVDDEGQDAVEVKNYIGEGVVKTVFQYSIQNDVGSKIRDTLDKLKNNNIEYSKLIIVTNKKVTSENKLKLAKIALVDYKKELEIFDKEKLYIIIADPEKTIMTRYFSSLKEQVETIYKKYDESISSSMEENFLRTCSVFYYEDESDTVRKEFVDKLVIEILVKNQNKVKNVQELVEMINKKVGVNVVDKIQINKSVERLKQKKEIIIGQDIVVSSEKMKEIVYREHRIEENVETLVNSIVSNIKEIVKNKIKLSLEEIEQIKKNILTVLVTCFRIYGYNISRQIAEKESISQIVNIEEDEIAKYASRNINENVSRLIIAEIARLFLSPKKEENEIINEMCRSYIASVILSIDPVLTNFQRTKISSKIFILDTDFILDTIIKESPKREINLKIIEKLSSYGCRIIIPKTCLIECINHARISITTYNHFGEDIQYIGIELVERHVWNAFVKGYYYYYIKNKKHIRFIDYRDNYYDEKHEYNFMVDVVKENIPGKIEIIDQKELIDEKISQKDIDELSEKIYAITKISKKAKYRKDEETREIAKNDAELYLIALYLNTETETKKSGIFNNNAYIISESNRYIKAVKNTEIKNIIVRGYSVFAILSIIGNCKQERNSLDVLADPLLSKLIDDMWDKLEVLIKKGIRLDDKTITRLRWDYDNKQYETLSNNEKESESTDDMENDDEEELLKSIAYAKSIGYSIIPRNENFVEIIKNKDIQIEQLKIEKKNAEELLASVEETTRDFGRRKKRYIDRMIKRKLQGSS